MHSMYKSRVTNSYPFWQAEWEALAIVDHQWALEGVEDEITGTAVTPPETIFINRVR